MLDAPPPPDFQVPWADLDRTFAWIRRLRDCPQDPVFHAEGDVWIHTRMVCEAMCSSDEWRALPEVERQVPWLAALLHDVAKPDCTREDEGKITSRGHSLKGAILAREILWRMGVPFPTREAVCALVRAHQLPFWLIDKSDPRRLAHGVSVVTRCDRLATLAEADARGRVCSDQQKLLDNVALFREYCAGEECLEAPRAFPSDHARFRWFSGEQGDPLYAPHESFRCEVVVMSGLPGAGKDTFIREKLAGWPVVSLDALRDELDVDPADPQGAIVQAARERAREHLRAGRSFVWNATNLSREVRRQVIRLLSSYDARIKIVYVESPASALFDQNRARERVVPLKVMEKLLSRWEVPDVTEAHEVVHVY